MHALMKKEDTMSVEDRLASLESDVKYLCNDMADVKESIKSLDHGLQSFKTEVAKESGSLRAEVNREFGLLRAEMNREFGLLRAQAEGQRAEMNREFGSLRAEMNKELGLVRIQAEVQRAETSKEFGSVRISIESLKTSIEKAKLWMLVTGVGVIMSTVVTLAHALKLF
jgi:chromosome segregation ATPase